MNLNADINLSFKMPTLQVKLHPHTWYMIGSLSLALVSLIVSLSFVVYSLQRMNTSNDDIPTGSLLNQLQVNKASQLLKEETAQFTIEQAPEDNQVEDQEEVSSDAPGL